METSVITHELAVIDSKVGELQVRSVLMSIANGLRNGIWMWIGTLVVLGGLVLLIPMPGFVRASLVAVQAVAILWIVWKTCIGPIMFRWKKKDWALYCEELEPRLDKRLVTCLDIAAEPEGHLTFHQSPVAGLLLKETAAEIALFHPSEVLPSRRLVRSLGLMLAPLLVLGFCSLVAPMYVKALFTALYKVDIPVTPLWSIHTASQAGVAGVTITPGDFEVARGGTIEFKAMIDQLGEGDLNVSPQLHIVNEEDDSVHDMLVEESVATEFNLAVTDVQAPFVYHATVAGLRTPEYKVTLFEPPAIASVTAKITPPEYLNEPSEEMTGTFFSVHAGSTVELFIESDKALSKAQLVPEEGEPLDVVAEGMMARVELIVDSDKTFRAIVFDTHDHQNLDPPAIGFEAIPDKTPTIAVKRPGADWALHPIGEMELRVEVDDDHGLQDVHFDYQVNDGEIQTVALTEKSDEPLRSFTGNHTLYLEDLDLSLGDVILYRFRARDSRPDQAKASSYSQPYFLTIRPYEQDFFKNPAPPGGGEGPQMPNQKEVIIATTRLIDRESDMDADILAERSAETAETQRVIEDRTKIVLEKMKGARVSDREARVKHIEQAIEAMQAAAELLDKASLRAALPQENSALAHLLAAFAGLPQNVPGQGSGSGGAPPMGLLGQKLDRDTEKYETMDGLPTSRTRELDEAIAKTKILAQRQKEFAETIRREREQSAKGQGGAASSSSSSPPPSSQSQSSPSSSQNSPMRAMVNKEEMLAALEESQRELQKLKDAMLDRVELGQEISKDLEQALQSAAQEMKRMNNAMRNEQWDEAEGANTRALEKMRQVQLQLQQAKLDSQSSAIQALLAQVESWKLEQEALKQSTAALGKPGKGKPAPSRNDVVAQQAALSEETFKASPQVGAMTPMANDTNPPDYMDLASQMAALGEDMKQASKYVRFKDDKKAATKQSEALERLASLEEELKRHLDGQGGDQMVRLREALAAVQNMREELAELKRVNGGAPQGELKSDVPEGSPGKPSESDAQSAAAAQGSNGSSGSGGMSRINSDPKNQPSDQTWSDGGPAVSPTRVFDKEAMTVQLETIARLLEPASPATPLVRSLEEIVASDMWAPPEGGVGAGESNFVGEFAAVLDQIAEIMAIELAGGDQLQRLNQAGVQDLPPRFREMVSVYFESLASQAQEPAALNQ